MGFHTCEYCPQGKPPATSSGDVTMKFDNGSSFVVPDMILHYVEAHRFQPPETFVATVLQAGLVGGDRRQTRSLETPPERVGYLTGEYPCGAVPPQFVEKLRRVMELAKHGGREPGKGFSLAGEGCRSDTLAQ